MGVTIKDIANYTGLSISTVSLVLNGKAKAGRISDDTVYKVEKAKEDLQYMPNLLASSLRRGFTKIIGIVISDISNPFFIKIASYIEQELAQEGYITMIVGSDENDEKCNRLIDIFLNFKVDGLILAVSEGLKQRIIQLKTENIPFVLLDRYFKGINANMVIMDNYKSSLYAVEQLIKLGRKRIATFAYDTQMCHMIDRFNGYKDALKRNKIRYDKKIVPIIPFLNIDYNYLKEKIELLISKYKVDAFYFQTTRVAVMSLKAMSELHYNIAGEISILCFHDNDFFNLLNPPVNSLKQPIELMGKECAQILIKEIQGQNIQNTKKIFEFAGYINRENI